MGEGIACCYGLRSREHYDSWSCVIESYWIRSCIRRTSAPDPLMRPVSTIRLNHLGLPHFPATNRCNLTVRASGSKDRSLMPVWPESMWPLAPAATLLQPPRPAPLGLGDTPGTQSQPALGYPEFPEIIPLP